MHGDRATGVGLLALLYGVSGLLCAVGALWPMHPHSPVALLAVLAVVGVGASALLWLRRADLPDPGVHLALGTVSALVGALAWQSVTAAGVVGLGPAMVAVGVFTGHFLPPRAARTHVALLLTWATAGAVASVPAGLAAPWLTTVTTVVVLSEAQLRMSAQLRHAAGTDPLTGVANRRSWGAEAARDLAHAQRSGEPLTVAVLDLDHFKAVNDEDGHSAGDDLLRSLALAWSRELRGADLLGRHGGDEFVLCLPGTDAAAGRELLARLHAVHPASWSVGTATVRPGDTVDDLLRRADAELYRAKRARTA
ncbi:GGDEF domain-containing protein [Trujillonella endophytica]|uniref:Diguanylate cyclase (GGDEF) domain-containing protein n=1 Tax=Trujillonella endophytica TaxID=673521 RepID=A0A1H8VJJ5_9ACTN|nr:GGDEF domain-containing protein [Trujillella endophytica]SEP15464.1 diguanylate cyclase (GGDEF) domain-containing protein [Trujillella endophytica]